MIGREPKAGASVEAIEAVYRAEFTTFERVARAIVGDAETARDVVQDAFASALARRKSFRADGPLEAWLWRTVTNGALSQLRRRSRPIVVEQATNGAGPDHTDIRQVLLRLPERQRAALFLRYYADLDYASIAATLGISEGTVAATLHAAGEALRRRYQEVRT